MKNPHQRWSSSTKRVVVVALAIAAALILYRFREVLPPLIIAMLLAFILDPFVASIVRLVHVPRGLAAALVLLILLLLIAAAPALGIPTIVSSVRTLNLDFQQIVADVGDWLVRPIDLWGYTFNPVDLYQEISSALRNFLSNVATGTANVVVSVASGVFWLIFVLLSTFYLLKDGPRLSAWMDTLAPPDYREDFSRLRTQISQVWQNFLRGQLLLSLVIGVITGMVMTVIGLPYALAMGVLAGFLEFLPSIGPTVAAVPAVLLAFFRGTALPFSPLVQALIVAGIYVVIQQLENNLLVPRIIGGSLNLHPIVILVAVIAGGSLGGVLGILLAAPIVATLGVVAYYVYCRLYDLDPFVRSAHAPPKRPGLAKRFYRYLRFQAAGLRDRLTKARKQDALLSMEGSADVRRPGPPSDDQGSPS